MVKWAGRKLIVFVAHAAVVGVVVAVSLKAWPDMKDKPPLQILVAGAVGAIAARYLLALLGFDNILLGFLPTSDSRKTDPVIGPAPKPLKTYEEWKDDLDKIDGQTGIEEFLSKWREVPRTKKGEAPPAVSGDDHRTASWTPEGGKKSPAEGHEIPNQPALPENVVGWIDKHYERASQLWNSAHPGQWERRQAEERERWERDRRHDRDRHERQLAAQKEAQERQYPRQ